MSDLKAAQNERNAKIIVGVLTLFSKIPLSVMQCFAVPIGVLMWLIPSRSRNATLVNLRLCYPELSPKQIQWFALKSLIHTAKLACEMGATWRWTTEKCMTLVKNIHGEERFKKALAEKKGVLVILPHLGNWEVLGPYMGENAKVTALYQPPKQAALEPIIKFARERNKVTTVPTTRRGVASLLKALNAGEVVVILPDQEPNSKSSGVFAPFMGVNALTMTLVHGLLQKTSATALFMFSIREKKSASFSLHFEAAPENIYNEEKSQSATAMNEGVANCIRHAPEQYQWEYKRFKSQEDGKRFYDA